MKSLLLGCATLALVLPVAAHAFQAGQKCLNPACAQHMMQGQCEPTDMMKKIDTNNDGTISAEEATAGAETHFKMMDTDGDGLLTEAEFDKAPRPDGVKGKSPERMGQMRSKRFMMMDSDANGTVTKAEFMAGADQRHARMDANRDGNITKEEMAAGREKMRQERWEQRREDGWRGWMPQARPDQSPRGLNE